jgi:CRISPR-associated protein Cas2
VVVSVPYAIIVYDVEADRTYKFLNYLRRYLEHVQNSVFEGELTAGKFQEVESTLEEMLKPGESVICYRMSAEEYVDRSVYGDDPMDGNQFL